MAFCFIRTDRQTGEKKKRKRARWTGRTLMISTLLVMAVVDDRLANISPIQNTQTANNRDMIARLLTTTHGTVVKKQKSFPQ